MRQLKFLGFLHDCNKAAARPSSIIRGSIGHLQILILPDLMPTHTLSEAVFAFMHNSNLQNVSTLVTHSWVENLYASFVARSATQCVTRPPTKTLVKLQKAIFTDGPHIWFEEGFVWHHAGIVYGYKDTRAFQLTDHLYLRTDRTILI